jgi:glycosyltransferase involved in cell wall biosynthesis
MMSSELPAPEVSVIIPAYNASSYLEQAIDSALDQQGVRLEVIVMDDGSTDDTPQRIAAYGDRILAGRQDNRGHPAARNSALPMARGEFLLFLDADDFLVEGIVADLLREIRQDDALGLVHGGITLVDQSGSTLNKLEPWLECTELDLIGCVRYQPVQLGAFLVRRHWVMAIDGFDDSLPRAADVDFLLRLAATGCPMQWYRKSALNYRIHDANLTRDASKQVAGLQQVLDNFFERRDLPPKVLAIQSSVRFYSFLWSAWRLYHTGQVDQIQHWLERSIQYSPYNSFHTVLEWLRLFANEQEAIGDAVHASDWLPYLQPLTDTMLPAGLHRADLLCHWTELWRLYENGSQGEEEVLGKIVTQFSGDMQELGLSMIQFNLEGSSIHAVATFWRDAVKLGLVDSRHLHGVVMIYLTAVRRALRAREFRIAAHGFLAAVRATRQFAAIVHWWRFICGGLSGDPSHGRGDLFKQSEHSVEAVDSGAISVIISAYNCAEFIGEAIRSVLEQSLPADEVIVVDDGSTDNLSAALMPFRDRIMLVQQENQGQSAARNRGLRLCKGSYVVFLDGDDALPQGTLRDRHAVLQRQPALGVVQGGTRLINAAGEFMDDVEPWHDAPNFDLITCLRRPPVQLGAMMIRTSWARRIGGFDQQLRWAEDIDFLLRLVLEGCPVQWLREPAVLYRQHATNITLDGHMEASYKTKIFDKVFGRTDLPPAVRAIEPSVRFHSAVWSSWRTYCRGQVEQSGEWLKCSIAVSPYTPQQSVMEWVKQFSQPDPATSDSAHSWLEHLVAVANGTLSAVRAEQVVHWWYSLWQHYVDDTPLSDSSEVLFTDLDASVLMELVVVSLALTGPEKKLRAVERFSNDFLHGRAGSTEKGAVVTKLYLTIVGQTCLARQWRIATQALYKAVVNSTQTGSARAWAEFMRSVLKYSRSRYYQRLQRFSA